MTATTLDRLGPVFRWSEARAAGLHDPALHGLLASGAIERISHGLYRATAQEIADLDLVVIASANPRATICLTSALARHGLTDTIPSRIDVALPRGTRRPSVTAPVRWHTFAVGTFDVGRSELQLDAGLTIGLHSPERSIIDAYRLRHRVGAELGRAALRTWLTWRGARPAELLELADAFPATARRLQEELEILG